MKELIKLIVRALMFWEHWRKPKQGITFSERDAALKKYYLEKREKELKAMRKDDPVIIANPISNAYFGSSCDKRG